MEVWAFLKDQTVFASVEAVLVILVSVAFYKDLFREPIRSTWNRWKEGLRRMRTRGPHYRYTGSKADLSVTRGDRTMGVIRIGFVTIVAFFTVLVQVCDPVVGYRVAIHLFNTTALVYLFFLSRWFRSDIVLPIHNRIRKG